MFHDVVVVGGGPVGGTLACLLARDGLSVAIVESRAPAPALTTSRGGDFDLRVSALTPSSRQVLRHAGAWDRLERSRIGILREMHVWDAAGSGEIHFDAADIGLAALGYVVENRAVERALEDAMAPLETLRAYQPARLESLETHPDHVSLRLDVDQLRAGLVVGADGSDSQVRALAGVEAKRHPYEQDAVVATLEVPGGHQQTAWQRFLSRGPIAMLPLPGRLASMVWSTSREQARSLVNTGRARFETQVTKALGGRLGEVREVGERASFPLIRRDAEAYVGDRVALAGDAVHTIHPLAGQGVNLGLLDAAALAQTIIAARDRRRDVGRRHNLRPYERWRKGHNLLMSRSMDGFHQLFGSDAGPVRAVRSWGLSATDRIPPLKRAFMRFAAGMGVDVPCLARVSAISFTEPEL